MNTLLCVLYNANSIVNYCSDIVIIIVNINFSNRICLKSFTYQNNVNTKSTTITTSIHMPSTTEYVPKIRKFSLLRLGVPVTVHQHMHGHAFPINRACQDNHK